MSFMKGIELCRRFHLEIVEPVMAQHAAFLSYSSALIGPGSEVLGYDTEMSTDHDWVPRVYLFLDQPDIGHAEQIRSTLQEQAPERFYGFPVDIRKCVITTVPRFIERYFAVSKAERIELLDWLTFPSQSLLEVTQGEVYRDDRGQLSALRERFGYYPHDIWLYLLASGWQRIGQEEHLMLRAGYAGDELGSAIIASRLVRDIMNLCFLMERRYAPYPKWFGTAFKRLQSAEALLSPLWTAQTAVTWRERERALNHAYKHLSTMHNGLALTEKIPDEVSAFYDRPFNVMNGEKIASLIANRIVDAELRQLSRTRLIGSIDQMTDNTDFRTMKGADGEGRSTRQALKNLFQPDRPI
ncbi:DUF4037 domain-containing protein [Paenibacillus sacheonensis]|uniref:DUF4037 domain-containing protein n=1 Tax=Paenibacillus sacheonensis TaxID=742054 RepID=A0A7X5C0R2_9BACL|nr:DUF4037 domain-containing protein [Paenibacillus sacheonensis]MBM7568147.1 hypothetical protein [Paenibacillus sacheonensis]NBC71851.1 DUF4037 domain-containing protein [Paenibacillus sacheonensis]